jgi:hypothetical protein
MCIADAYGPRRVQPAAHSALGVMTSDHLLPVFLRSFFAEQTAAVLEVSHQTGT